MLRLAAHVPSWLKTLALAIAVSLAPIKHQILVVFVLVVLDFATGVWASLKKHEKITSAGFGRTAAKIVVYEFALISGFLAETYLTGDTIPVMHIINAFIGLTELKSVLENLSVISGTDLLRAAIGKLTSPNAAEPK